MPKQLFRKYLPTAERLRSMKSLGGLGAILADPNLWHLNRRSLSGAAFIGISISFVPIPMQMLVAAVAAVRFKCNLPLSLTLIWISNPLTYVPMFYFSYRVGTWALGMSRTVPEQVTVAWFVEQLIPLWVGAVMSGLFFGAMGFLIVRLLWRLAVVRSWRRRRDRTGPDAP